MEDQLKNAEAIAKEILADRSQYMQEIINLAEMFMTLKNKLEGVPSIVIKRRLQLIRNHNLEEAACTIEKLEGRKRGAIMKEAAQFVRKEKVVL